MVYVKAAAAGVALSVPTVIIAEAVGVSRHDFQVFLLGLVIGATVMLTAVVWVARRRR
jgi:hypothetical protein